MGPSRRKARQAEEPKGILPKGRADMREPVVLEVVHPTQGVVQLPLRVDCHGIDGEVASQEVIFQPNLGSGEEDEAFVALAGLSLGSCERVFRMGRGMQEDGKVPSNWPKASSRHFLRGGPGDKVVTVVSGLAEQDIADGPSHTVNACAGA
jgi:hypothetical protein